MEYASDLFDAATIDRMLNHAGTLLSAALENPSCLVSRLPLMSAAEQHRLVNDWNATEADYPRDQRIHNLIEAYADQTPNALAVIYERETITYAQLDMRANQLACGQTNWHII